MGEMDEPPGKGAYDATLLNSQGRYVEALARVDELAAKHPGFPIVLHCAGRIHYDAALRAVKANQQKESLDHLAAARGYLTEAKRLVPNCVDISGLLAWVLLHSAKAEEAEDEARRALGIAFPVDPVENNVVYSMKVNLGTSNRHTRVENCREGVRTCYQCIGEFARKTHIPRVVCEVLELGGREAVADALRKANDLARRYPDSPRAQFFRAYMRVKFAHGLDATIDRRCFLHLALAEMNDTSKRFANSLVLSIFRAKLWFIVGLYQDTFNECTRVYAIQKPADPKLEDVPVGSVNGEEYDDRVSSIHDEVKLLLKRLIWVAKGFWCSMSRDKQDGFILVRLTEMHKYYDKDFGDSQWAAKTISEALSFVEKTRSWKFWICPFCVSRKFPGVDSLWGHMRSQHSIEKVLLNVEPVLDPKRIDDTSEGDYSFEDITVSKDSDDQYVIQFKRTDYIFEHLFLLPSAGKVKSFTEMREEKHKEATEFLGNMRQRLKILPADKMSTELIQDFWHNFFSITVLDYRVVLSRLSKSYRWCKLIEWMRAHDSSKRIDNTDIDMVFPNVVDTPGSNDTVEDGSKISDGDKDHKGGDDQQTENIKPSCSDDTLKMDDEHKESVVNVEDENSGAILNDNQREVCAEDENSSVMANSIPSDLPTKMIEDGYKIDATQSVGMDLQCDVHVEVADSGTMVNNKPSGQEIKLVEDGNKLIAAPENVGKDLPCEFHVEDENSGVMENDKPSDQPIKMVEDENKLNATPENVGTDPQCEVHVEDENSGGVVDDKPSDIPMKMVEDGNKLNATPENVGTDLQCDVHVEDENSGGVVDDKPSDKPMKMVEDGNKLNATSEEAGTYLKCDSPKGTSLSSSSGQHHITKDVRTDLQYDIPEGVSMCSSSDQNYMTEDAAPDFLGISGQSVKEMASICRYRRSVDVLTKYDGDEDLFFLNVIVQSLWSLRHFRNEFLRRSPACFHLIHEGPCITGKLYELFSSWEKNEHFRMAPLLIDVKTTLCEIVDGIMFEKMQVGTLSFSRIQVGSNFISEIMAMILEGLHKSEICLHFSSGVIVHTAVDCSGFICRAHDLFGIKFKQLMSCSCGEWFGEEHTSIFHELDASSLNTTKIESLAQLPVLMDKRSNCERKCNKCSETVKHIGCFLSNRPYFLAIDLKNWKAGDVRRATMSNAFFGIASPFDITLLYKGVTLPFKGVRSSTKYKLVLAICHLEERYISFVREQDKWYIYDIDTVKVFDSWEELLERYREISLRPEVLFFEVIK